MAIISYLGLFIVSLAVLIKGSDLFVAAAEKVGVSLGMSPFIIGVVIVGIGTSLPELASSIAAVLAGSSEIVIGNVLGSNITNIFLVLGLTAIIAKEFKINYDLMRIDLPVLMGSSLLLAAMILDSHFSIGEAILCLLALTFYMLSFFKSGLQVKGVERNGAGKKQWLLLLASPILIFGGAKYTIDAVVAMAALLSIGSEVIALSAVALGTSLPEVFVTISATKKGNAEIAIGNIIGSNIFNSFAVMGVAALFGTLKIPASIIGFSLPVSIFATLLYVLITVDQKINRWEGSFLLIFYIFFVGSLYGWV